MKMPFHYKRKLGAKQRIPISLEGMTSALNEIRSGQSIRATAMKYNLNRCTLRRYAKNQKNMELLESKGRFKTRQVFTISEEKCLVDDLLAYLKMNGNLTRRHLLDVVYNYAKAKSVMIPSSWTKKGSAGKGWLQGFFERNPEASRIIKAFFKNSKKCPQQTQCIEQQQIIQDVKIEVEDSTSGEDSFFEENGNAGGNQQMLSTEPEINVDDMKIENETPGNSPTLPSFTSGVSVMSATAPFQPEAPNAAPVSIQFSFGTSSNFSTSGPSNPLLEEISIPEPTPPTSSGEPSWGEGVSEKDLIRHEMFLKIKRQEQLMELDRRLHEESFEVEKLRKREAQIQLEIAQMKLLKMQNLNAKGS